MEPWQWAVAVAAGAVGQFLDTIAGMGFGALTGSVMVAGGMAPTAVVATVSLAKIGSGLSSAAAHWGMRNVRPRWVVQMAVPGVVGGVASAFVLAGLPADAARLWVPVVLFAMGVLVLRRFVMASGLAPPVAGGSGGVPGYVGAQRVAARPTMAVPLGVWLAAVGFAAGAINGISGAFGPVATTAVTMKVGGHPRHAIGSVNAAEFFVAVAVATTLVLRTGWQTVGWQLPTALVAGSLCTAPLGAYLVSRLSARVVGIGLALVLLGLNGASVLRALA